MLHKGENTVLTIFLLSVLIAGVGLSLTSSLVAQQRTTILGGSSTSDEAIAIVPSVATATQTFSYYDDTTAETHLVVYRDEWLQVRYTLGATYIVTGTRFYHRESSGTGPYDINITYVGDSDFVRSTLQITASTGGEWWTSSLLGPGYVIDDDPAIQFESYLPTSTDCMCIGADGPNIAHSFYSANQGSSWTQSASYEYMVDVRYETIQTLGLDAIRSGDITGMDNVDAYYVTLTGGKTYQFALSRDSGVGTIDLRLVSYVSGGKTGADQNSTSGSGATKTMRFTPSVTTTYMLLVEPLTGSDDASYSVFYTEYGDDSYEPNDLFGNAYPLTSGTLTGLKCADDDWYMIYAYAGTTLTANISFWNGIGDLDMELYNSTQGIKDSSTSANNFEDVSLAITTSNWYYIRVYRYGSTVWNSYAMTVTAPSPPSSDDSYEENDALASAASISASAYTSLVCGDDDWYKLAVSSGNTLVVTVTPNPSGDSVNLMLTYSSGNTAAIGTVTAGSNIATFQVTSTETYYIKVSKAGATNTYGMTITITPTSSGIAGFDVFLLVGASTLTILIINRKRNNFRV